MRNLIPTRRTRLSYASSLLPLSFVVVDPTDALLVALGPSDQAASVEIQRRRSAFVETVASWDLPTSEIDEIVDMQLLSELGTICLCMMKGDIIFVPEDPTVDHEKTEIVGTIKGGILAASWAPDQQVLCLVTGTSSLLLMTKSLNVIADIPLSADDITLHSNQVSLGWGRAETQFRGKRAKAVPRDPTLPEKLDQGIISPLDDGKVRISWRGDSAYVAISRVEDEKRRAIRVYSREGVFDSISEPVDGLEGQLSWRPSGNLIASIQRNNGTLQTVFFERNGLRHGEFNLEQVISANEEICETKWNVDSTILAVLLKDKVQLWTMSNYHYYLKQEICHNCNFPIRAIRAIHWHPEKPLELLVHQGDFVEVHTFVWSTISSSNSAPNDYGLIPVVDGKILKLTPLRLVNIPPPMSFRDLNLETPIKHVSVSPNSLRIAALRQDFVDIIEWEGLSTNALKSVRSPSVLTSTPLESIDGVARQIVLLDDELFIVVADKPEGNKLILYSSSQLSSKAVSSISFLTRLQDSHDTVVYQSDNGTVHTLRYSRNGLEAGGEITNYPFQACHLEAIDIDREILVVALNENGKLFANQRQISSSCTSFVISKPYLVYTATQHTIRFIRLSALLDESQPLPEINLDSFDERIRPIERGSRIVSVLPSKYAIVLQMPRGNLETITPRTLVLAKVRSVIDNLEYRLAFDICRTHRIDFNILCDYRFDQFMNNIALFVTQISKVEYLDLFLSMLKEEDVTVSMYKDTPHVTNENNQIPLSSLNVLEREFMDTHLQSMTTAHCSKTPADLEAALALISKLKCTPPYIESTERLAKGSLLVDGAIEHICFLADVNKLFDYSLGLYDLELAMLIANNSQKDPREFMPFLQQLHSMDSERRQYTINDHLKRYSKALDNLLRMDTPTTFEEAKIYTNVHTLYLHALKSLKHDKPKHASMLELYATYLHSQKNYHEAGLAYESISRDSKALESYSLAGSWRECLSIASRIPLSPPNSIQTLSRQLSAMMIEKRQYAAAATIRLEYLDDLEGAVEAWCKGNEYAEACRAVTAKGRHELLQSAVKPSVVEGFVIISQLVSDFQAQYIAQSQRLRILRTKKTDGPDSIFETTGEEDVPDNISLAPTDMSTSASLFTRYTGRTARSTASMRKQSSKSKRREERKKARGKKGTIYEEDYLINSIRRLIERINSSRDEIDRLLSALIRFGMFEQALEIQLRFSMLILDVKNGIDEIFIDGQVALFDEAGDVSVQTVKREPPDLEDFQGLSFIS
ncbi:Elongator complex protein 1 [Neolecta irregularis DAH-3]|uniref:Elongator complex protein 1 n=1 Tax=Neolecta irregularis (strain DAH-3) TaxID=1198029 RepID=A0A1U7LJU8_NEOID|nr:Elongator complex protein 1 [Neolecta irregularis DAH-3]|eukprot:OLL22908.1 Elongator complex protein 1 [Neolecta irregularis DAH-3]